MSEDTQQTISEISVKDLKHKIDANQQLLLLDVRTTEEFASERITGAINVPVDEVRSKVEQHLPNKSASIYVYCHSGARSAFAVEIMTELGYTAVYDVIGGISQWATDEYPLET